MEKVKELIGKVGLDKIGYVGAALMAVGVFLPVMTMRIRIFGQTERESVSLFSDSGTVGWIMIISALVIAGLIYMKKSKKVISLLTGVGAGVVLPFMFMDQNVGLGSVDVSWGIGLYLMILGVIACGVYSFFQGEKAENTENIASTDSVGSPESVEENGDFH